MDERTLVVLLIEDNPADATLMQILLEEEPPGAYPVASGGFTLEQAEHLSSGLERLRQGGVDLVLLDLGLPDSSGLDTFYAVQEQAPHLPIVVLTGLDDERLARQAIRSGAQDYLLKGRVDGELLLRSLCYALERKRAEQSLRRYGREQATLYAVSSAVNALLDPDELLQEMLDLILPLFGAPAGWVTLPGNTLDDPPQVPASLGIPQEFLEAESALPLRECPVCSKMIEQGARLSAPQFLTECLRLPAGVRERAPFRCHVSIPLSAAEEVLGLLNIAWPAERPYTEAEGSLLLSVGRQIGMALHNAQLYQAARQV
ncbi:MAG: response regulator, partial [Chloroflexia bacterium]|nr:response regulator [Chloroflexia bacterium]